MTTAEKTQRKLEDKQAELIGKLKLTAENREILSHILRLEYYLTLAQEDHDIAELYDLTPYL